MCVLPAACCFCCCCQTESYCIQKVNSLTFTRRAELYRIEWVCGMRMRFDNFNPIECNKLSYSEWLIKLSGICQKYHICTVFTQYRWQNTHSLMPHFTQWEGSKLHVKYIKKSHSKRLFWLICVCTSANFHLLPIRQVWKSLETC